MAEIPLTAAQAEKAVASNGHIEMRPIDDEQTVRSVQQMLKDKGWVEINEIDGKLGVVTKDAILSFRTRNNLPLVPTIDAEFIDVLTRAPAKVVPLRQATASPEHIAERVEAVKDVQAIQRQGWWSKLMAWIIGAPSLALTLLGFVIGQLDEAIEAIQPLRNAFGDVIPTPWILLIGALIAFVFGYQQYRISKLTAKVEEQLVDGYRIGTVKNDAPNAEIDQILIDKVNKSA